MSSVQPSNEAFLELYNVVMPRVHSLLFENLPPRVFHECKSMFQSNPLELVGVWFCYEDHTKI